MSDDPEIVNRVVSFLLTKPANVIGDSVFSYRYSFHEEEKYTTAWLMTFYGSMLFSGSTSLRESIKMDTQGAV
jgi:hypothetical protein